MNELFVTPQRLIEYVRDHRDDADAAEAMTRYLPVLAVPRADWGELDFAAGLDDRWTAALTNRTEALDRLRERMSEVSELLRRAAGDFAEFDAESLRRLRDLTGGLDSAEGHQTAEQRLDDGRALLAGMAAAAGLGRLPTAPVNRESPGSEELMSCRAEHLTTLERAEGLLRDSGQLDFTAPSEYLRRLATVRPGTVGGRAEPLSTLSSYLDEILARREADIARLSGHWLGESAESFGEHARTTADSLRDFTVELDRLSGEAESLWRLLDTLLHDVAEAIWGQVAAVGDSRIARIGAAVDLVEDVHGFAAGATGDRALWGGLSEAEVDAAVQLLYKRVWYLANAMATLVSAAGADAATRLGDVPGPGSEDG